MKNKLLLFCILATTGIACQKELTDDSVPAFWAVTNVLVTNADTKATIAVYDFEYDSASRRATKLSYTHPSSGINKTFYPQYGKDTIVLGPKSYLVVDASKRITQLSEYNARTGVDNGEYYYLYNGLGQLEERLLDNGTGSDAIRTTFDYDKGELVEYNQDFKGFPLANSASLKYHTSPRINGFGQYSLLDIFPELLLYMPCINIGKQVYYPVSEIHSQVSIPAPPTPPYTTYYSNFQLSAEGYITAFDTKVQVGTGIPVNTHYEFTYRKY